jgi:hypothetical protein
MSIKVKQCTKIVVDGVNVYFTADGVPDGLWSEYKMESIARLLLKNTKQAEPSPKAIVFHPGGVSVGWEAGHDIAITA